MAADTYGSDCLHAQHKRILGQIARVAQTVLLPQLAKQVLLTAHPPEVVGKVALEEQMNAAAKNEPHDGRQVAIAQTGAHPLDNHEGDAENDGATSGEHANQLQCVPLIRKVSYNLRLDRVVWVHLPGQEGKVASCHDWRMSCPGGESL